MKIKVHRSTKGVWLEFDSMTMLLKESEYATLRQEMFSLPAEDVLWQSCVTFDMVSDWKDWDALIGELDDSVERAYENVMDNEQ